MDSTPPSRRSEPQFRTKFSSRLSKLRHYRADIPQLSLEIVPYSPKLSTPSPASTLSPRLPYNLPLRELLMISPSPTKRSKKRLSDTLAKADDAFVAASGVRKRCNSINALLGCAASPRSSMKSRRRLEQEMREEREFGVGEELMAKSRKKRNSGRPKKEKSILVTSASSPETTDGDGYNLDRIEELISDWLCGNMSRIQDFGFFIGFSCPKMYSTYSTELSKKVEYMKSWAMETWGDCTHKKIVAASFVTALLLVSRLSRTSKHLIPWLYFYCCSF